MWDNKSLGALENATEDDIDNFLTATKDPENITSATYPHSPDYDYESYIDFIDFDKEREVDIATGKGFIIEPAGRNIKKDLKAEDGIFSTKFGQTLSDVNPFIDRYKCRCGKLRGRINSGLRCPECGKLVEFVDDDFSYFGWMVLNDPYMIIHPAFYKKIEMFLGKGIPISGAKRTKLDNILDVNASQTVISGKLLETQKKDEPFFAIGMIEFIQRFDEIMDFYLRKKPQRKVAYDDIMEHRNIVFTHSIPVFTTLLRPFDTRDNTMTFEPTNAMYSMMNKQVTSINKNATKMQREPRVKNQHLFDLQKKFMELYGELENILSGKKGDFRCLLGGRYNFSSRSVIVQDPDLRIDQVTLSVIGLTILLEQAIKNILHRVHGYSPVDANDAWYRATIEPDEKISGIIQTIIDSYKKRGMPGIPKSIGTLGWESQLHTT